MVDVEGDTWDSENSAETPPIRPTYRYIKQKEGEKELEYHTRRDDAWHDRQLDARDGTTAATTRRSGMAPQKKEPGADRRQATSGMTLNYAGQPATWTLRTEGGTTVRA